MIRKMKKEDICEITKLALLLWPEQTYETLFHELMLFYRKRTMIYFVIQEKDEFIGFAHCQLRTDYVEGTSSSPVGYLEAIFVVPKKRHQGYATRLVEECILWAKSKGCTEFASDCEIDNIDSYQFHRKLGFIEVNRVIAFVKNI
ncbi:MAG: GNAT family N-acetyltransferase [Bacilli bacterium]|nr:GNAT family N-acetyltransferase [Bacilli bacterium]